MDGIWDLFFKNTRESVAYQILDSDLSYFLNSGLLSIKIYVYDLKQKDMPVHRVFFGNHYLVDFWNWNRR